MKVFIGSDHRGFSLKEELVKWLGEKDILIEDVGPFSYDGEDDYVDFAEKVGRNVSQEKNSLGIVICGSGTGVDIAANKLNGIRAGLGFSMEQIKMARKDDDINVLALAADFLSIEEAKKIIDVFLSTPFSGEERHKRRIDKIAKL